MRFAISVPQFVADGTFEPAALRSHLVRAEELGFESAWTQEQVLGSMPSLGPIELMTYAAACTERLRLGCAVFVTPLHSPVHLAKSLSSLDQLSLGRVEVGVGTGGKGRMFSAFGVGPEGLVSRFDEGTALLNALWTQPEVTFEGRFWQLHGGDGTQAVPEAGPADLVRRQPSCRAAASRSSRRRLLRRRLADDRAVREQARVVREELATQGRDPSTFSVAKRVYIAVDDDGERARERVAETLARVYSAFGQRTSPVAVFGPPDARARRPCGGGRRRRADPLQHAVRRRRADGAPGGRGDAAAVLMGRRLRWR